MDAVHLWSGVVIRWANSGIMVGGATELRESGEPESNYRVFIKGGRGDYVTFYFSTI